MFNPPGDLLGNLLNIPAEFGQPDFPSWMGTVSWNDAVKLKCLKCLQCGRPLVRKTISAAALDQAPEVEQERFKVPRILGED